MAGQADATDGCGEEEGDAVCMQSGSGGTLDISQRARNIARQHKPGKRESRGCAWV